MQQFSKWVAVLLSSTLTACASNTTLDDGSYRTMGQKAPRQIQNAAVEQAGEQLGASGRQVPVDAVPLPDFPGATQQARLTSPAHQGQGGGQIVRYGHPRVLDKIVRIAHIHCQPVQIRISTHENSFWGDGSGLLTQCSYQFPEFCGAHTFSVLAYGKKQVLIYKPKDNTHYVIDTLSGTPKAQSGLWDQDDHIGTSTTNAGYFLEGDYNRPYQQDHFNPASLGWIIKASYQDEEKYGRLYHQAVSDVVRCF